MNLRSCLLAPWLLVLMCGAAFGQPATADKPAVESVRPGINDNYLDPDLNPEEWVKRFEVESREVFRARRQIAKICRLEPGQRVADIGAGTGLFTMIFAEQVGPRGRVFAVDIVPKFIERIDLIAKRKGLLQVEARVVGDRDRRMPMSDVDCVFVCDVYHHFEFPTITNHALLRLLKPGGRLIVVDFERIEGQSREFVLGHVRAGKATFREEIEQAGFEFVREHEPAGLEENYCLEFRRPPKQADKP
ncbi:hypothetical protein KOR34_25330 [Posidoniimonas corsicana]|uniref:Methyltransferase domain-containing protein n=1 Tax=Posidoniimonas corsicana TaxID=1938618 RepID=A0A5C5VI83_9BACT|nr:methyltransferase domain-containing protein [Posidoniimonas corsicana]TWT37579.1 hypothetical protein KOR34_25330 [Posidoniimonas corsicana]